MSGFTQIPNAIMRDTSIPPTTRLLYGVILSYAWGDAGQCTRSAKDLATEAGIGRSAFFEGIALLRERDLLRVEKRKVGRTYVNVYIPLARGVAVKDDTGVEPDPPRSPETGLRETNGVQQADLTPSATRTQNKTNDEEDQSSADALLARSGPDQGSLGLDVPSRPKVTVNRKVVKAAEWKMVEAIMDTFNSAFDTSFAAKHTDMVKRVVMRLREDPTVSLEEHRRIIAANAAAPWWGTEKPDTMGVIYSPGAWPRAKRCNGVPTGKMAKLSQRASTLAVLDAMERGEGQL